MAAPDYRHLAIDVVDGVASVTIERPERLNTLSSEAHRELEELWPDLQERDEVDVVVLSGAGGVFGAGGDVKDMLERTRAGLHGSGISTARARRLVTGLLDFEKPVVAAVEGRAYGLSATIALLCDFVVASEGARFADPHLGVGLVPGDGGAAVWTVLVGPHRARSLLLRGETLDAAALDRMGLLAELVAPGEALARSLELAADLTTRPQVALRGTKIAINAHLRAQFVPILETSLAYEYATLGGGDFRRALEALADKRAPEFDDRWGA